MGYPLMEREYQSLTAMVDATILLLVGTFGVFVAFAPDGLYRTLVVDLLGGSVFDGQRELLLVVAFAVLGGLYLVDWVMD